MRDCQASTNAPDTEIGICVRVKFEGLVGSGEFFEAARLPQEREIMKRPNRRTRTRTKKKRQSQIAKPRSLRYSRLTAHEKATRERTLNLLSDLRRGKGSYRDLLRKYHLRSVTARKYLGRDLIGGTGGKPVRASKADRRVRELMFPKSFGDVLVRTCSSRDATKLSEFFHDRDKLLRGKLSAEDFEAKWRGVRVAGEELFADAFVILGMADADVLKLENLYGSTGGAR
jgi:hypothetical protein